MAKKVEFRVVIIQQLLDQTNLEQELILMMVLLICEVEVLNINITLTKIAMNIRQVQQ
jgi:hypothetical protein